MAPRGLAHRAHRIRIALEGTRPQVWRRVEVPAVTRLGDLHTLIQVVMGWEDAHLHSFEFSGRRYSENEGSASALPTTTSTAPGSATSYATGTPRVPTPTTSATTGPTYSPCSPWRRSSTPSPAPSTLGFWTVTAALLPRAAGA